MADEINKPSEFSQTPPELSEKERIQKRIQDFRIGLKPQTAQVVNALLETHLKNGGAKLNELEAMILVRDDIGNGLGEYNLAVETATKRLNEILAIEELEKQEEFAKRVQLEKDKLNEERLRRKELEKRVEELIAQVNGQDKRQAPEWTPYTPPELTPQEVQEPEPTPAPAPKPKSKAWDMIRATRPAVEEETKSLDDVTPEEWDNASKSLKSFSEVTQEDVITEDGELQEKIDETKQAVEQWKEENVDTLPDLADLSEFDKEVIQDEDVEDEDVEDVDIDDAFQVQEEDTETQPDFAPTITAGNAPNLRLVDDYKDLESAKEEEGEEEYDEIVIPNKSELQSLTKSKIKETADVLGFEVDLTQTKAKMIDSFVEQSEAYIKELTEDSGFISASETDEDDNDNDNSRDGGYF
jgi:hypothetical protein